MPKENKMNKNEETKNDAAATEILNTETLDTENSAVENPKTKSLVVKMTEEDERNISVNIAHKLAIKANLTAPPKQSQVIRFLMAKCASADMEISDNDVDIIKNIIKTDGVKRSKKAAKA